MLFRSLSVEIAKSDWDAMFDMYEEFHHAIQHPAVREAWEQYQIVKQLVKKS